MYIATHCHAEQSASVQRPLATPPLSHHILARPRPCVMKTIHCNFFKLSNKGNQWNKNKVSLCIPSGNQIVLIMMCVEQNTLFFIGRYLSSALIYVCTQCGSCHMLVCPYAVPLLMMRDRVTILWSPDHRWPVLPARQWW